MRYKVGKGAKVFCYAMFILWSLIVVLALIWIGITSFKTNKELYQEIWKLPAKFRLDNYEKIWSLYELSRYFFNSILVVPLNVIAILILAVPSAFVIARALFKGRQFVHSYFIFGMGVPVIIALFPTYFMLSDMKLLNSFLGISLVYIATSLSFTIFMLYGFFQSYPVELDEAATIDGCTPFQAFMKIVLPLSSTGIITVTIFNFIGIWNEYMLAMIYIRDEAKRLLSVGIYALQSSMQYTGDWVTLFAGVVLALLPVLIFFIFMADRIMDGMTVGAVKG